MPSRAPLPAQVAHVDVSLEVDLAAGAEDRLREPDLEHDLGVGALAPRAAGPVGREALVEEDVEQVPEAA